MFLPWIGSRLTSSLCSPPKENQHKSPNFKELPVTLRQSKTDERQNNFRTQDESLSVTAIKKTNWSMNVWGV